MPTELERSSGPAEAPSLGMLRRSAQALHVDSASRGHTGELPKVSEGAPPTSDPAALRSVMARPGASAHRLAG